MFFIFQSVWIENSLRIAAFLASVIVLLDVYTIFHNPIFHYFTPVGFQLKSEQLKVSLDSRDSFIYLPNPSARAGYDTRSIFKRSFIGLNSEFSFSLTSCLTKAEEPSLPYYLRIAGERIIGFIPFPRVLMQCEMQSGLFYVFRLNSRLYGLESSSDFPFPQSPFQTIRNHSQCTNYSWYHRHLQIPLDFQFSRTIQLFVYFPAFFHFYSMVLRWNGQIRLLVSSFFSC